MISEKENNGGKISKRLTVILVVILLISASLFSAWYFFVRPISVDELVLRNMSLKDGDVIKVTGKISEMQILNTSYGERTVLTLNGSKLAEDTFKFLGNNSVTYHIGDRFTTTLHFHRYLFNDKTVITAPELYSPFLIFTDAMQEVSDSGSFSSGFELIQNHSNGKSTEYRVFSRDNSSYPLNLVNASIIKDVLNKDYSGTIPETIYMMTDEYSNLMSGFRLGHELDYMCSLTNDSENGIIEFTDTNSDNLLDDGDIFTVNIPPTENISIIDTYLLLIQGPGANIETVENGLFHAEKYILNWYAGPYEVENGGYSKNKLALAYVSDKLENGSCESLIEITNMESPATRRYTDCEFRLEIYERDRTGSYTADSFSSHFSDKTITDEKTGLSLRFIDSNNNSLLDAGDFITVSGLENGSRVGLSIGMYSMKTPYGRILWYAGYGHVSGSLPDISFSEVIEEKQYLVSVNVSYWHSELEFNHTLRFSVGNSSGYIIENRTLVNDQISSESLNITFVDADGNNYLSTGDYFIISDYDAASDWKLTVSLLFGNHVYKTDLCPSNS